MLTRRDFLQVAAATAGMGLLPGRGLASPTTMRLEDLTAFEAKGQVTLLNFTDIHAQLKPLYYREPSINLGVGEMYGKLPHLTGKELMSHFGLAAGSSGAHAFSSEDFVNLARHYGRVGGLAHLTTLVNAIRAERPERTLLVDNGDTWQGSYTSLQTRGADMVEAMNALGVDVMTGHWEFTYGTDRVKELIEQLKFPFVAGNILDTEWEEPAFESTAFFERGGVKIAVIGQAFPYTPVANPRHMIPGWSFGVREDKVRENVQKARDAGAQLVVLASHNGFDVDRKLASRVEGIDVILTGHTHDALPGVVKVGNTLMVASGSHGKFLARLDLDVRNGRVADFAFKLIPVFSDVVPADSAMQALIGRIRAPHEKILNEELARTDSLLYRRGNFNGTFDDLLCEAMLSERDAEIALSPGFRWGSSLLPGMSIRAEDVFNQTAITYPNCYRMEMTGERLHAILEDVADNLFNPDPYYQQGGDMVRVGGMGYTIDIRQPIGKRISDMTMMKTGQRIDPKKSYVVTGWASVNPDVEGPAVYDVVSNYLRRKKVVNVEENRSITIHGA